MFQMGHSRPSRAGAAIRPATGLASKQTLMFPGSSDWRRRSLIRPCAGAFASSDWKWLRSSRRRGAAQYASLLRPTPPMTGRSFGAAGAGGARRLSDGGDREVVADHEQVRYSQSQGAIAKRIAPFHVKVAVCRIIARLCARRLLVFTANFLDCRSTLLADKLPSSASGRLCRRRNTLRYCALRLQ